MKIERRAVTVRNTQSTSPASAARPAPARMAPPPARPADDFHAAAPTTRPPTGPSQLDARASARLARRGLDHAVAGCVAGASAPKVVAPKGIELTPDMVDLNGAAKAPKGIELTPDMVDLNGAAKAPKGIELTPDMVAL